AVDRSLDDPPRPCALHERVDAAVVIGDEEHARGVTAGEEHLPDDTLWREHRGTPADSVRLAAPDGEGPSEAGGVTPDDTRRQEVADERVAEIEQLLQALVLELELRAPIELLLQQARSLSQGRVLGPGTQELTDTAPAARDGP